MGKTIEYLKLVQTDLKGCGYYDGKIDGIPGPLTDAAFSKLCKDALAEYLAQQPNSGNVVIKGTKGNFSVLAAGKDLQVHNVRCTCFGGTGDAMDNGETASGFNTKDHPDLMAVSLPMNYTGKNKAVYRALNGSPIPEMPFGLHPDGTPNQDGAWVNIKFANGKSFIVPVVDLGPNIDEYPNNAIDATLALAKQADPHATANNFEAIVDYTILNGTKWLTKH